MEGNNGITESTEAQEKAEEQPSAAPRRLSIADEVTLLQLQARVFQLFTQNGGLNQLTPEDLSRSIIRTLRSGIAPTRAEIFIADTAANFSNLEGSLSLSAEFIDQTNFTGLLENQTIDHYTPQAIKEFANAHSLVSFYVSNLYFDNGILGKLVFGFSEERELFEQERDFITALSQALSNALLLRSMQLLQAREDGRELEKTQQRLTQLESLAKRAVSRSKEKSELLSNMSHELRTPLTAVIGYGSVLEAGVYGPLSDSQKTPIQAICRAAEHLKNVLNDILDLSRAESGQAKRKLEDINILDIATQVKSLLATQASEKQITLAISKLTEKETLLVSFDARHLKQILLNLVSNAVKFTPEAGNVSINIKAIGDKVHLSVSDTGVGISEEDLDSLFERYTRGNSEYASEQDGTGLGLHLSKQLAEINGAQLGVESSLGKGSTFTLIAPQTESSKEVEVTKEVDFSSPLTELGGLKVLVVDDSRISCELLSQTVSAAGGDAFSAHSISEALNILDNQHIDCVLLDLAFPGEHGTELMDFIRLGEKDKDIRTPILVVSACILAKDRQDALLHGADRFIAKPFDVLDILKQIRQVAEISIQGS